jgi:biotin carboxyl carrier protein
MGRPLGTHASIGILHMKYITTIDDKEYLVEILDEKHVSIDGKVLDVDFSTINGQRVFSLIIDGKSYEAHVNPADEGWEVLLRGRFYSAQVEDEREKRLRVSAGGRVVEGGEYYLKAPMPGLVIAVLVEDGKKIEKGDVLIILESMKMQNELKSPKAGIVSRIKVKPGERVEQKAALLTIT